VTAGRAVVADHSQMADALAQKMGLSVATNLTSETTIPAGE